MVKYTNVKAGYRFILTPFGLEEPHVRAKYEINYEQRTRYEKQVPTSWVEKGYVTEVKIDG